MKEVEGRRERERESRGVARDTARCGASRETAQVEERRERWRESRGGPIANDMLVKLIK